MFKDGGWRSERFVLVLPPPKYYSTRFDILFSTGLYIYWKKILSHYQTGLIQGRKVVCQIWHIVKEKVLLGRECVGTGSSLFFPAWAKPESLVHWFSPLSLVRAFEPKNQDDPSRGSNIPTFWDKITNWILFDTAPIAYSTGCCE